MDTHQQVKSREKAAGNKNEELERLKVEGKDLRQAAAAAKQVLQVPITAPASPPSASSSPSHEFSFTISLHHSSTAAIPDSKSKTPPSFAIDLSPADDIFFHGHLLPLHLLSHLPVSPRSSTNSLDSFTLPIRDLSDDLYQRPSKESNNYNNASNCSTSIGNNNNINKKKNNSSSCIEQRKSHQSNNSETRGRTKSKSFSLFGLTKRKDCENTEREDKEKHKRKLRFDVSHILKRYVRMVRPLLFFRRRRENIQFRRQPYSFSGNLSSLRNKQELRGRRGEFSSAPASMRTSPTNSGLLLATSAENLPSSTSDSTMEELHAAIQAAIAHCKNSIATEEKLKC